MVHRRTSLRGRSMIRETIFSRTRIFCASRHVKVAQNVSWEAFWALGILPYSSVSVPPVLTLRLMDFANHLGTPIDCHHVRRSKIWRFHKDPTIGKPSTVLGTSIHT